uniref:Cysteine protease n=1 Tax=Aceria tosichella TaxID=561515 RepID=A0A6G1S3M2_9ACAR
MRPIDCLLEPPRRICSAFYRCLLKLNIDAHQHFAYWKSRLRLQQHEYHIRHDFNDKTNVDLTNQQAQNHIGQTTDAPIDGNNKLNHTEPVSSSQHHIINNQTVVNNPSPQFVGSKPIKTPRNRKFRLFSFLHRLSPRHFMDYCVIALNEASGSSSSNRFDLSSFDSSIWLLGRQYDLPGESEALIEDIKSKLWITYRRNFPPIDENTRYTTDRGFGCMIRCGQMVLANALLYKNLGRDWRWSPNGLDSNPIAYTKILKLFQDRQDCLYSIHRIIQTGQHEGKTVGEWFGPNTIAQALKRMSTNYLADKEIDASLVISIEAALDNMVVIEEIKKRFRQIQSKPAKNGSAVHGDVQELEDSKIESRETIETDGTWVPGILFIQLRLGLTKINPLYFAALKKTFQFKNSLGIIGGRPNHALYLVGYTNDDIIYLDPHNTQQYVDFDNLTSTQSCTTDQQQPPLGEQASNPQTGTPEQSSDSTYHCSCPEKMPLDRLDPSLALCFYFSTEKEFDDWCDSSQELLVKSEQAPMFEITRSRPTDWNISITSRTMSKSSSDHDGEEFEILT